MSVEFKKYIIPVSLSGYFGLSLLILTAYAYYWHFSQQLLEQPIAFPHQRHVSDIGISCDFCHNYANKSINAGIPSVKKCIDCHSSVATEKPEIKKLLNYWENRKPIPWVRIHSLPDYIYFSHKRHVLKNINCSECHGEVDKMDVPIQVRSLQMGWCVNCHRARGASTDCLTCHK